ncbi:MAG: alpha/beta hydrolase [Thaumarchaeota archaeon]|nr:alpha/beta hydrolase [Nitrososphaerota archaeon]
MGQTGLPLASPSVPLSVSAQSLTLFGGRLPLKNLRLSKKKRWFWAKVGLLVFALILRGFDVPTLLIWSENDPYVPPEHGKRLNQDIPGSKLIVLEDTGHFILEERPQQVTEAISSFLAG